MAPGPELGPPVGYVSDERFVAVGGASLEFNDDTSVRILTSSASGAVYGDLPDGRYRVTIARDGYGSKRSTVNLVAGHPHQFRLLSERVCGYVWPKWVRAGEAGSARVHSPEAYRLSWSRLGAEQEPLGVLTWIDEHGPRATVQVTPDGDYTQPGLDWAEHASIPAPERSGLYCLHVEAESGVHFSMPWVVAPAAPSSEIAVLASTNTWNAYNNFGGRSNYINVAALPATPTVHARTDLVRYTGDFESEYSLTPNGGFAPLSFKRPEAGNQIGLTEQPTDPIRGRMTCALAAAEWRLLSWLERNDYAYDYYAEAHLDDGTLNLDDYRVLILSTHPEYWSRAMYEALRAWTFERGGRLMYLGGNGVDGEVEFNGDALVFNNHAPPDGDGFESRMHRSYASTSALLGQVYTDAGAMTAAPYAVVEPDHWVFAGTGLRVGELFGLRNQSERVPGGASGHETDKRTKHTPPSAVLLAKGCNVDDGGAEVILFPTASGGEVFSVGSITWTTSILVDDGVAAVTRNVLDKFLASES